MDAWYLFPTLALIAGVIALAPLGVQVLQRGVVFIDLAVAQAAAATVIWLDVWLHLENPLTDQIVGTMGALGVTACVVWVTKRWATQREALIGLLYVVSATMSLLGASLNPHGKEKLLALLAADVLWADAMQAITLLICALAVLLLQHLKHNALSKEWLFYACFAVVASFAVSTLGLFLVFTCLISPALWMARGISQTLAIVCCSLAGVLGLTASWAMDAPSGPMLALCITIFGLASAAKAPRR